MLQNGSNLFIDHLNDVFKVAHSIVIRLVGFSALVRQTVKAGSILFTDYHGGYHGMYKTHQHGIVDHEVAYVFGDIHTNNAENFWSLLKRTMRGTYVSVEPFHLHRYLGEYSFRFNNRKDNDGGRFRTVTGQVSGKRLTYKELTGKESFEGA